MNKKQYIQNFGHFNLLWEKEFFGLGYRMFSRISFGCAPLGQEYGFVDKEKGYLALKKAFKLGPYYGRLKSENLLGEHLERLSKELTLKRSEYFISTKCGRYDVNSFDFSTEKIKKSVLESLDRLKTDYLDICICHDIEFVDLNQVINESIPVLQDYKKQGVVKKIGISGYPLDILLKVVEICNSKEKVIDIVLSYCHFTLQNDELKIYAEKFKKFNIEIINASPLSMGLLRKEGPPQWHPASKELKELVLKSNEYCLSKNFELSEVAIHYSVNESKEFTLSTLIGFSSEEEVEYAFESVKKNINKEIISDILKILEPVHNQKWNK